MEETRFIEQVLKTTSVLVREKYAQRAHVAVTSKSEANDLLTEVDLAVQEHIVEQIRDLFPNDLIAAEEGDFAKIPGDPDCRCWVVDPIDGTQNFVRGLFPTFGISIALAVGGTAVAGGVALPIPRDIFLAARRKGAFRNGQPLKVTEIAEVGLSRIEIDFSGRREREEMLRRAAKVITTAGQIRCNCSTVVALCSIASGDMEAFVHVALNPWDYAAGQLIVEEAGGVATRLDGAPLRLFDHGRGVLITNGRVHHEIIELLS
jgi:myo-inositol-1(or 4)-monophosphatase